MNATPYIPSIGERHHQRYLHDMTLRYRRRMVRLFHYTSTNTWPEIRKSGQLLLTSGRPNRRHNGPGVVWLTTHPTCEDAEAMGLAFNWVVQGFADFDKMDKTRIRIEVEVPKTYTHRYADWVVRNGGDPNWQAEMRRICSAYGSWRVHTRAIPKSQWVGVIDTQTGREISIAPTPAELGFRKLHA